MGWICPDCSSENAFLRTHCEACGRKISAGFLLEEKKADRREHKQTRTVTIAARTAGINSATRSVRVLAVVLRCISFFLAGLLLPYFLVTQSGEISRTPRIITPEVQVYLENQLDRIGGSFGNSLERADRAAAGMDGPREALLQNQLREVEKIRASNRVGLDTGLCAYPYGRYLAYLAQWYGERAYQRLTWIPVQASRVIQFIGGFVSKLFSGS